VQYDTYVQRLLIASFAVLIAGCGTTHCLPSAQRNDTPVIIVQNHGGFLSSISTVTVAVYQDGTLFEQRDNGESSCRLLGSRELAILSMIMDRHHAVDLLEGEHVDRCCISEDRPFVYWQIGVKAYRLRNNGGQLLPLARDLDRFFRTYLGDRNYVTPFVELRR
jgi:hypothetical protein